MSTNNFSVEFVAVFIKPILHFHYLAWCFIALLMDCF